MLALLVVLSLFHISAKDNGRTFTLKPHTPFVVALPWTPGTGYLWEYKPAPGAHKLLRNTGWHEIRPKNARPGAQGKMAWDFRTRRRPGTVRLLFRYIRPWEKQKVARRFSVTIGVR